MSIADILQSVHFMVDQSGKPTAAVVDMPAWEAFLQALEEISKTTNLCVNACIHGAAKQGGQPGTTSSRRSQTMAYRIWIKDEAKAEVRALPGNVKQRARQAIARLGEDPRPA